MKVLFFSSLQDITQTEEYEHVLQEPTSVVEVLDLFYTKWPDLKKWDEQILIAKNMNYVDRNESVSDEDELAIMPPVQGG